MKSPRLLQIGIVLLFVISPASVIFADSESQQPPPPVAAHFHLSGTLTETPLVDPFNLAAGQVTSLKDLIEKMDKTAEDDQVEAVVLTYDSMSLGFGQLEEIRNAVERIEEAGKMVYVHAEGMNIFVYAMLCAADDISLAPHSIIMFTGIYTESVYVKSLLDKIGVQADFLAMGDYKSAAEMLTRTGPSEPAAENIDWLLDSYYESLIIMIAESRGMTDGQVKELIDNGLFLAEEALDNDLVDAIETREQFLARLKEDLGDDLKIDNNYGIEKKQQINIASPFALFGVLAEMLSPPKKEQKDTVGLIYIDGTIISGHSQPNPFGSTGGAYSGDIRKALEKAAEDDTVKVVVMRVDSPGGSAEASEVILNAAKRVRTNKPVIVSMGNVAGSGGYYVSCGADYIFADAVTVTASIGVVGGKLITTDMWGKLGVNWVPHKRGANADFFTSAKMFDEPQREMLNKLMLDIYEVFKGHVAEGRGDKLAKDLEDMAGGRVYTGKQALELGLVDEIGGLKDAVEYAAAKVSITDYDVRVIPRPKDFITQLMEDFSGEGEKPSDISTSNVTTMLTSHPTFAPLLDILRKTEPQRAKALYQALQRVELIRTESVIMMMPFDLVIH